MKTKDIHLLGFYTIKPRDPRQTYVKGYMSNPDNIQYDEQVGFSLGLKTRDQVKAGIILNLSKKTVVKNTYDSEQKNFDELFKYFLENYTEYVAKVMAGLDVKYLEQFIPEDAAPAAEATAEQPAQVASDTLSTSATV
ncbi:MAG TPA: hypothetical protein VFM18_18415 [Methanosarcina sp.]|nr:hypothetical protein [Methanosarcina sp.]